jgi:hypothetical protein
MEDVMEKNRRCTVGPWCTLNPPDPQLKGAWYPGGFNPRTHQVKTRFQSLPFTKMQHLRRSSADILFLILFAAFMIGLFAAVGLCTLESS